MAKFRAEAVADSKNGKWLVELYHPDDASTPFARSAAVYPSEEAALADTIEKMKKMWPDKPITVTGGGSN